MLSWVVFDETDSCVAVDKLTGRLTTDTQSDGVVEDAALVVSFFFYVSRAKICPS